MRPVDADALKEWVEEYHASNWGIPQDELIYAIGSAPTIEPKRGKWEMKPDPYGWFDEIPVCSACGCTTKWREKYSYCPNCGAKMERSEE